MLSCRAGVCSGLFPFRSTLCFTSLFSNPDPTFQCKPSHSSSRNVPRWSRNTLCALNHWGISIPTASPNRRSTHWCRMCTTVLLRRGPRVRSVFLIFSFYFLFWCCCLCSIFSGYVCSVVCWVLNTIAPPPSHANLCLF